MEGNILLKWIKENGYDEKATAAYRVLMLKLVRNITSRDTKDREILGMAENLPAPGELEYKVLSSLKRSTVG